MVKRTVLVASILTAWMSACAVEDPSGPERGSVAGKADGERDCTPGPRQEAPPSPSLFTDDEPAVVALLAYVNDAELATFDALDAAVGLDCRAAAGVVLHREGQLTRGEETYEAESFGAYEDLDDLVTIPHLKDRALHKLVGFLQETGRIPEGDVEVGVHDGIAFTAKEAEATLRVVNDRSLGEGEAAQAALADKLMDKAGFFEDAAWNVARARPFRSMAELAAVEEVGPEHLGDLRHYAVQAEPIPGKGSGDSCTAPAECGTGLHCFGMAPYRSGLLGKCRPVARLDGEGAECGPDTACGSDELFCSGTTIFDGQGFCRPNWMRGTFAPGLAGLDLPADEVAREDVFVHGLASVPEDIVVELNADLMRPEELIIRLYDPNGTESVLWYGPEEEGSFDNRLVAREGISRDDEVNGTWTLEIENTGDEDAYIDRFELIVSSRWD